MTLPKLDEPMSAYDFLTVAIPAVIREEPKRLHMADWVASSEIQILGHDPTEPGHPWYRAMERGVEPPACNTVGCIAGWGMILLGYRRFGFDVKHLMRSVLNLDYYQSAELFEPSELVFAKNQGTPEHAEAVIAHIHAFAMQYETQLKAVTVVPLAHPEPFWREDL